MQRKSLTLSAMFHVAVIVLATVSLPWLKKDFVIPPPVMVEFVEIGPVTETTKVAPKPTPPKPEEKKEEPPPPPAPQNTAKEVAPPVPKAEPQPPKKPEPKKDTAKPKEDPTAPPDKKAEKKPEPKKEEKPEEPQRDFSSVLKNLAEPKPAAPSAPDSKDMGQKDAAPVDGQNAPLGQKMTMSEEDALRRQLEKCWNVPYGAKDARDLVVEIFMVINPDRTLRDARVVDIGRYNSDSFFRAAADSALRAVRNPLCSPFQLPPDKYDVWKTVTVNFNPSEMF